MKRKNQIISPMWWKFWNPKSGFIGGVIAGLILLTVNYFFGGF